MSDILDIWHSEFPFPKPQSPTLLVAVRWRVVNALLAIACREHVHVGIATNCATVPYHVRVEL